jgi:hypothetical protein
MSYLAQPTSTTEYGVVKVGNFIDVDLDGVISLEQDVGIAADVIFDTVSANELYDDNNRVVTSVTPAAGSGISVTGITTVGPSSTFTVNNTGVLSLIAGSGITLSNSTGDITVSSTGADLINVYGTTTNYTATLNDEYIGVNSANAVSITLPLGVDGRVYIIKDERGQGSGKITIQPQFGEKIDNAVNYVIGVPYQSVQVVFRAGDWWIM